MISTCNRDEQICCLSVWSWPVELRRIEHQSRVCRLLKRLHFLLDKQTVADRRFHSATAQCRLWAMHIQFHMLSAPLVTASAPRAMWCWQATTRSNELLYRNGLHAHLKLLSGAILFSNVLRGGHYTGKYKQSFKQCWWKTYPVNKWWTMATRR